MILTAAWASGEPPTKKCAVVPPDMMIRDREQFWSAVRRHRAVAAACAINHVPLPMAFLIAMGGDVIGRGSYASDAAADRAAQDVTIVAVESELRGRKELTIYCDLSDLPVDQQTAITAAAAVTAIEKKQ